MRRSMMTVLVCVICLAVPSKGEALGFGGMGASVGLDLTQSSSLPGSVTGSGASFNSARLAVGGFLNLGEVITANLDLVPGFDALIESELKIYSINTELRYRFHQKNNAIGYAGGGIGIHLFRPDAATGAGPARATGPLGRGVAGDRSHLQAGDAGPRVVYGEAVQSAVDDRDHAVDGDRGLGDVGAEDQLALP